MNEADYHSLREQIEGLLTETRLQSRNLVEWQKVETYWLIGDTLSRHINAHTGPKFGQQIVRNLSKDLQLGYTTLYEILRFRRVIADPKVYARTQMGWSHFRALIHLPPEQLDRFAALAAENQWTTRQLKQAIEAEGADLSGDDISPSTAPLRPTFGEPWTYRVVADRLLDDGSPAIDFGFHQVWVPDQRLAGFASATPGDHITLENTPASTHVRLHTDRPRLWTYLARILRVIDGDTIDVVVDLGLGHRAFPRLRLRGIDTAELYTQAGRQARDFVERVLSDSPVIIIATRRTDSYGRYLADVIYLPNETAPEMILAQGTYLSGQLLREKLATRYLG